MVVRRTGSTAAPVPRLSYQAQVLDAANEIAAAWQCEHDHKTPTEAHACGVQQLMDRESRQPGDESMGGMRPSK